LTRARRFAFLQLSTAGESCDRSSIALLQWRVLSGALGLKRPTSQVTLNPGTRVGRYEIGVLLGMGGSGEVYRAPTPT
jgi:hypothetical protein